MRINLNQKLKKAVRDAGEVGQFLWAKGWAEKNAGNFSMDVTDLMPKVPGRGFPFLKYPIRKEWRGRCYLVTGTGTRYRDIRKNPEECLCLLKVSETEQGFHLLWGGQRSGFKPTSELPSHLLMQGSLRRSGTGEKVVLHTHPNELIALTHLNETNHEEALNYALWGMIPEAKIYVPQGIGLVPYRLTASEGLAEETVKVLERGHKIVLWEKHGVLAVGEGPQEAFDLIDAMNKSAILYLLCRQAGEKPQGLTRAQIEEIGRAFPPMTKLDELG